MARRSAADLSVVALAKPRPSPPAELAGEQAEVWKSVVASKPPEWFDEGTFPLLVAYCRISCDARATDALTADVLRAGIESDADLSRYERLNRMRMAQASTLSTLATKMRLSQQSRYGARHAERAARDAGVTGTTKPWDYGKRSKADGE